MRTGATISGAGHLGLLAVAVIGLGTADVSEPVRLARATQVEIVTEAAFEAARSAAPQMPSTVATAIVAPDVRADAADTPDDQAEPEAVPEAAALDAPDPELPPDLSTFELADPDVALETVQPEAAPVAQDSPLLAGPEVDGSLMTTETTLLAPAPPVRAPRVDSRAAPKPPERSAAAAVPTEATVPTQEAAEPVEEVEAAAPEASTTEISPDAEDRDDAHTPTAAMRPPGRPPALVRDAEDARRAEAEAAAEAERRAKQERAAEEAAIAAALAEAEAETARAASGDRLGGDFSSAERRAVGDVIHNQWNTSLLRGRPNFETLVVVVRVRLSAAGKIMGDVEPVDPASPSGDLKFAFDTARRAVILAANRGLPLPQGKFRDGDYLEIRFDPVRGAVSFD